MVVELDKGIAGLVAWIRGIVGTDGDCKVVLGVEERDIDVDNELEQISEVIAMAGTEEPRATVFDGGP